MEEGAEPNVVTENKEAMEEDVEADEVTKTNEAAMEEDVKPEVVTDKKKVTAMEEDPVPGNNSKESDLAAPSQFDVAVSWELPQQDEGNTSQNAKVDVLNSEKLQNGLSSQLEHGDVVKADLTAHFETDQVFNSRTELINWCQEVAKKLMTVVLVTKSENSTRGGRKPKIYLGCERGGVFRDLRKKCDSEGRQTTPKKCGCPFVLLGMKQNEGDRWKLEVQCGIHSHPIDQTSIGQSPAGKLIGDEKQLTGDEKQPAPGTSKKRVRKSRRKEKQLVIGTPNSIERESSREEKQLVVGTPNNSEKELSKEEKQLVIGTSKSRVRARDVLRTIKEQNKRSASTLSTIDNSRSKRRKPKLEYRDAIQELLSLTLKNQFVEWHRKDDETNEVKDLCWTHPESLQLVKCFPSILMVDCTCKTNKFNMPLFEFVGSASTGKTFTIAFVILETESEDNYVWVLSQLKTVFDPKSLPSVFVSDGELAMMNAINRVFPNATHLVCTLHISRCLATHCKSQFPTDEEFDKFLEDWTSLIKSETQIDFVDRLAAFEHTWSNYPDCLAYLEDNWFSKHKEHFVSAWTNLVKHYGNTSIIRDESADSRLKTFRSSPQGTIMGIIWRSLHNMINGELTDVKASMRKSLSTVQQPSQELDPLSELRGSISHVALEMITAEVSRSQSILTDSITDSVICGCALRQTHGLPCAHEIVEFINEGRMIPLSYIDSHWKKLSVIPSPEIHCLLVYEPEYLEFTKKWEASSEEQRMLLITKIQEFVDPEVPAVEFADPEVPPGDFIDPETPQLECAS